MTQEQREEWLKPDAVRRRFGGISNATLYRWEDDPQIGFPPAIRIRNSRYWRRADIEAFEARVTAKANRLEAAE
jgi:predicted DNA-binding transcriptional regulator AlpA